MINGFPPIKSRSRIGYFISFLIWILTYNGIVWAQHGKPYFHHLKDDFPHQIVEPNPQVIYQDTKGFIWFAGITDIQKYDGYEIKSFQFDDPYRNPFYNVYDFLDDSHGNLWILYNQALFIYDHFTDRVTTVKFDLHLYDGNPQSLRCLYEDNRGNLWIGTNIGNTIRIPLNTIIRKTNRKLNTDSIFIHRKDFDLFFYNQRDTLNTDHGKIFNILQDKNNEIWLFAHKTAFRFIEDSIKGIYELVPYLARNKKNKNNNSFNYDGVFIDDKRNIWQAIDNRLYKIVTDIDFSSHKADSIEHQDEESIKIYPEKIYLENLIKNNVYIEFYEFEHRIHKPIYGNNEIWTSAVRGENKLHAYKIYSDVNGELTFQKILDQTQDKSDPGSWDGAELISQLYTKEEIIWFTDYEKGPVSFNHRTFSQFTKLYNIPGDNNSLPAYHCNSIVKDNDGNLWFAFPEKIGKAFLYQSDSLFSSFDPVILPAQIEASRWQYLQVDDNNNLWFLTEDLVLYHINLTRYYEGYPINECLFKIKSEHFGFSPSDKIQVWDFTIDNSGQIWVICMDASGDKWGYFYYNTEDIRISSDNILRFSDFFSSNDAKYVNVEDTDHFYYIGHPPYFNHTYKNPIYILSEISLIKIDPLTKEYTIFDSGIEIANLSHTPLGHWPETQFWVDDRSKDSLNLYVSTLNSVRRITFNNQKDTYALISQNEYSKDLWDIKSSIYWPIMDDNYHIWFESDYDGIYKFNPDNEKIIHFRNDYTNKDLIHQSGFYKDPSGKLYYPANDGITIFHPDSVRKNTFIPQVEITEIELFHKSLFNSIDSIKGEFNRSINTIILPFDQNTLTFQFTSLSYSDPDLNQYAYYMSDIDQDTVYTNAQNRSASYTKIMPGKYTFKVGASNNDQVWNKDWTSLNIVILPPWWLTIWAKITYVVLFISSIWGFIFLRTQRQRKKILEMQRINKAFQKFVPYEFLSTIGREAILDVKLGDHSEKNVTVLFLDIRDYTPLAETMKPDENFKFINHFVGHMGPIIAKNKGFINQYMGDAIMAIFPDNSDFALKAAIELQNSLASFNEEVNKKGIRAIKIGIGLHTGGLVMGIIGDEQRIDPATIADSVNVASRMEGLTKHYGVRILLSEETVLKIKFIEQFHLRFLGEVLVKGKKSPVRIFECIDSDEDINFKLKLDSIENFQNGLTFYNKSEFEMSTTIFSNIYEVNPMDKPANFFYNRSSQLLKSGVDKDWTGLEKMEGK